MSQQELTNEQIAAALNGMKHLGFADWQWASAREIFFSKFQLRDSGSVFTPLHADTARVVVAYAASRPHEGDIIDEINQIVFESTSENLSDAARDEIVDLILGDCILDAGSVQDIHSGACRYWPLYGNG